MRGTRGICFRTAAACSGIGDHPLARRGKPAAQVAAAVCSSIVSLPTMFSNCFGVRVWLRGQVARAASSGQAMMARGKALVAAFFRNSSFQLTRSALPSPSAAKDAAEKQRSHSWLCAFRDGQLSPRRKSLENRTAKSGCATQDRIHKCTTRDHAASSMRSSVRRCTNPFKSGT